MEAQSISAQSPHFLSLTGRVGSLSSQYKSHLELRITTGVKKLTAREALAWSWLMRVMFWTLLV